MSKIFFIILIIVGLTLPIFALAQLGGPIVPCGREGQSPCTLCDIFRMMQTIITFIGVAIFVIATIFIAVGGVITLTSAGSPDKVGQGKAMITSAIIGIIIALLSWVIINEVLIAVSGSMSGERVGKIFDWPWNRIQCVGGGITEGDGEEVYCVCEYGEQLAGVTKIKATQISGYEDNQYTCNQLCTSTSSTTYCGAYVTSGMNLYCAQGNSSSLTRETACMLNQESWERVGSCYATLQDCNTATDTQFHDTCYPGGTLMCHCNSDAPTGLTDPCTSSNLSWAIFKRSDITFVSCYDNVVSCSNNIGSSCHFCKLDCPSTGPGSTITVGTCTGVNCSDSGLAICGSTSNNCSTSQVNSWNTQIQAAASGHSICGGINTVALVKAIMARESGGVINRIASDGQSAGLMQLVPVTAERFKSSCEVTDTITLNWLTNSANAEAQICMAIEFLKSLSLVGACGCDIRQLAAGYNGGGGKTGACEQSTNCGSAARADGGECLICPNESFTRRWECLWDDNKHTVCNADRAASSFEATRKYVPQVNYCYSQF